mgnify:CR=1 FL=1
MENVDKIQHFEGWIYGGCDLFCCCSLSDGTHQRLHNVIGNRQVEAITDTTKGIIDIINMSWHHRHHHNQKRGGLLASAKYYLCQMLGTVGRDKTGCE